MPIGRIGPEFIVNTTTENSQDRPSVAALADGGFVVAWESYNGSDIDIRGRIFNADGSAVAGDFANDFPIDTAIGLQREASVTGLTDGRFVVTWDTGDVGDYNIKGGIFDPAHNTEYEFTANTTTTGEFDSSVTALAHGGFVVTWESPSGSGVYSAIRARVYGADEGPLGNDFLVSATATANQTAPSVAALADGGFVETWSSYNGADDTDSVHAHLFHADGSVAGDDFVVNNTPEAWRPSVTALSDGGFVVAWVTGDGSTYSDIRGRVFNADGSAAGDDFLVNTKMGYFPEMPSVTALADGRFVVTWDDQWNGISARLFDADGGEGNDFTAGLVGRFIQTNASVAALADDHFVVTWVSGDNGDGSSTNIRAQLFDPTIFYGTVGDDNWRGGSFADHIDGGAGNDMLSGKAGNDTLSGGLGSDIIDGGAGADIAVLAGLHGAGFDIVQSGGTVYALDFSDHSHDAIANVESFQGPDQTIGLSDIRGFDALAYAASYDDLAEGLRTDANAALTHYLDYGFLEHRTVHFDAAQYLANYADLSSALGTDTAAATVHFLTHGVDEHRLAENPLAYIASYADLIQGFHGGTEAQLRAEGLAHYAAYGDMEGRRGGIDFDAAQYLANYADLRAALPDGHGGYDADAATTHYIDHGYFEHRLWQDPLVYIASNADLIEAFHGDPQAQLDAEGLAHYQSNGYAEGRAIDFDADQYLANYADLRAALADGHGGYDEEAAILHYIDHGYFEGRTDDVLAA